MVNRIPRRLELSDGHFMYLLGLAVIAAQPGRDVPIIPALRERLVEWKLACLWRE